MKNNPHSSSGLWSFNLDTDIETTDQSKFDLYLKSRELRQLSEILRDVTHKPRSERLTWIRDNEPFINQMMENFADNSIDVLEGINMDFEAMRLSAELISNLRETTTMIRSLMEERGKD